MAVFIPYLSSDRCRYDAMLLYKVKRRWKEPIEEPNDEGSVIFERHR